LYVDDKKKEMGDKKYLVSPKDLMGIGEIKELKALGINSFKIEGRLKTPEYVASTARNYREVMDGHELKLGQRATELSSTYSRGFFTGWLKGVDHQQLVDGTFSAHRGLELGVIKEIKKKTFIIETNTKLEAGMGLLLVNKEELGSKIFDVKKVGKLVEVELVQKNLTLTKGMKVYLNSDEGLDKELQKGWQSREFQKRISLKMIVQGVYNEPILVKAIDPDGREVYAQTISFMAPAKNRSLTEAELKTELSSLGGSIYELGSFECFIQEGCFMNHRELKDLRRELIEKMNAVRILPKPMVVNKVELPAVRLVNSSSTGLNILLRSKAQVDGFAEGMKQGLYQGLDHSIHLVVLDFEFGKDYAASIEMLKELNVTTAIATTRILKPKEYHNLKMIIRCKPDKILVRNLGAIEFLRNECSIPLIGDFSLNVTNSLTADYLLSKGLETVNTSYDLNQEQLLDLISHSDPSKLEVTLHQYMPEFHMEHCVFAAFLSTGSSFKDCGKPCEKHEVKLKDPYGNWHFLKADHECRNTFFKATPQSASFLLGELKARGVKSLRIEALNENTKDLTHKILVYLKLLNGGMTSQSAVEELKVMESYGLGKGQLNKTDTYKDRKKESTT
nr:DUF3656 domain-containing protein [Bdellovibrionales bacterium]